MRFATAGAVLLLMASCATPPSAPVPALPVPLVEVVGEVALPPPEPVVEANPPAPPVFQVSEEKKTTSLAEIRTLVERLNAVIARKSFAEWTTHLDDDYIKTYSDPFRLREISSTPFLKQFNLKLKSLEDYFKMVVVPSRADGRDTVDDITFLDENRVEVWSVVDNEHVLLYLLKRYGKEWKISVW